MRVIPCEISPLRPPPDALRVDAAVACAPGYPAMLDIARAVRASLDGPPPIVGISAQMPASPSSELAQALSEDFSDSTLVAHVQRVAAHAERRRSKIMSETEPRPLQIKLDLRSGRLQGPLGPTFPFGAHALHLALRSLGEGPARELGREVGRETAAMAKSSIAELAGLAPTLTPPQLVASALDDTLANVGLGRIALDFTEYAGLKTVGCLLRPPLDLQVRGFAAFYEGLLGVAVGSLLDRPLLARCLDTLDLTPTP